MYFWTRILHRWLPAVLMMLVIFWFSAQPGSELLFFDLVDRIIKKGGHMIGYAFLALSYWRGFDFQDGRRWFSWLLAVLFAVTDELHQAFVPNRNPSLWDVVIFDNFGALIALWVASHFRKEKRPAAIHPVAERSTD
jgi:hypothetical protein